MTIDRMGEANEGLPPPLFKIIKTKYMTPNFEYHLKTVLRTRKVANTPDMTTEKHLRASWSSAKQVIPSKLLKIQHRILILN